MKNLLWFFIIPILFAACDSVEVDPTIGTVDVNMKGTFGNTPLVLNDYYEFDSGMKLNFATLLFYLSDVRLVNDANEEVLLTDISFVNFYNNHSLANGQGEPVLNVGIKEGHYKALRLGVGIPASVNATNPSDYSSESPLSRTEMYWTWRSSYIFSMVECNLDTLDNGGNPTNDMFLTYHSGADAMFQTLDIPIDFMVKGLETQTLQLAIDAKKIFITDTVYDVKTNSESHSDADDFQVGLDIIERLALAISVE